MESICGVDCETCEYGEKLKCKGCKETAGCPFNKKCFIILDEAQNTSPEQMKMFLTRLGFNSKMVINGDITQIDLSSGSRSGLKDAIKILKNVLWLNVALL